jgi:hypothetical protein
VGRARRGSKRARAARRFLALGAVVAVSLALWSCEFIYDIPVKGGPDASGTADASTDQTSPPVDAGKGRKDSAPVDAGGKRDTSTPDVDEAAVYQAFTNAADWSTFDMAGVDPGGVGFAGGTFDGRYVYFAPNAKTVTLRYDTTKTFTSNGAWSHFDVQPLIDAGPAPDGGGPVEAGGPYTFFGSAFDGVYVYLLPGGGPPAFAARYDTKKTFTAASGWEVYDLAPLGASAYGFGGGTFDGKYVYVVPYDTPTIVRYDTSAPFSGAGAGWSKLDTNKLTDGGVANGYSGAIFDGRYVYLVPGDFGSLALQYDTTHPFGSPSSWSSFDTSTLNFNAYGYAGGAFDGRYLYFVPHSTGIVMRYDTTSGSFSSPTGWAFFNARKVKPLAEGFFGGAYDGRYIYFVPEDDIAFYGASSGLAVRYDTTQSFFDVAAWSTFDTAMIANASGFSGAVFDGEFVYFVPYENPSLDGIVARFDSRTPPAMPKLPDFHGSFF